MSLQIKSYLLLPHIKVLNANALSSAFSVGFPAVTAFMGMVHAMQRHLNHAGLPVQCLAVGIVSHDMQLQTHRGLGDYVDSIISTGNPLQPKAEKDAPHNAVRPSFIEEARCHLDVSLVVEVEGVSADEYDSLCQQICELLHAKMKLAGGDILSFDDPEVVKIDTSSDAEQSRLARRFMPGYALIERRDLMQIAMSEGQDAIDSILDCLAVHHRAERRDSGEVQWTSQRRRFSDGETQEAMSGWVVPIATGFQGLTAPSLAQNQRDNDTPHRFAESVVTLGEFVMTYRLPYLDYWLWRYEYDVESNLYLCSQSLPNECEGSCQYDY